MAETCGICLESLTDPGCQTLECKHVFHSHCIAEMRRLGVTARCPFCRASSSELTTVKEMFDNAVLLKLRGKYADAARKYLEILDVDRDHYLAAYNLGLMYYNGDGVEEDKAKAAQLYKKASAAGHAKAAAEGEPRVVKRPAQAVARLRQAQLRKACARLGVLKDAPRVVLHLPGPLRAARLEAARVVGLGGVANNVVAAEALVDVLLG